MKRQAPASLAAARVEVGEPGDESAAPGGSLSGRAVAALVFLTLASFAWSVVHLDRSELFVDEAATWWYARLIAAGDLGDAMGVEPTPPLYYGLVSLVIGCCGESDWVLRLPSALFAALSVPALFLLGRALYTARVGWLAAVLWMAHPLHLVYSREARVYPLLLLLTLLAWLALWRALETGSWCFWLAHGALLTLTCYAHFYGLFLLPASALTVAIGCRRRGGRWRGWAASVLAALAFAPYLAWTLPRLEASGAAWSLERLYLKWPEEKDLSRVLEAQMIGATYHPVMRQLARPPTPSGLRLASLLAQAVLLGTALRSAFRSRRLRPLGFLLVAWLVPVLIPWGITHLGRPIFHPGRHDHYALGAFCLLLAVGLQGLSRSRRWGRSAAVVVACVLTVAVVSRHYWLHAAPPSAFHRQAGRWIAENSEPGERVIAFGIRRSVTEHYARLGGAEVLFESYPRSTDRHPGWADPTALLADPSALAREASSRVRELGELAAAGGPGRVFLLARRYVRSPEGVSEDWLIDRHMIRAFAAAGWRRVPRLEPGEGEIMVVGSPAQGEGSTSR